MELGEVLLNKARALDAHKTWWKTQLDTKKRGAVDKDAVEVFFDSTSDTTYEMTAEVFMNKFDSN